MIKNIAAIIYNVSDITRACEYYQYKLGLELTYKNVETGWAEFDINGVRFALKKQEPFGNGNNPVVSLYVENLERIVSELDKKGVRFPDGGNVETTFFGNSINIQDPDGNIINLFEKPG